VVILIIDSLKSYLGLMTQVDYVLTPDTLAYSLGRAFHKKTLLYGHGINTGFNFMGCDCLSSECKFTGDYCQLMQKMDMDKFVEFVLYKWNGGG